MNMTDLVATVNRAIRTNSNDRQVRKDIDKMRGEAVAAAKKGQEAQLRSILMQVAPLPGQPPALAARRQLFDLLGVTFNDNATSGV